MVNPIETEMDEAIENARAAQGLESFDESCLSDLRVKQKYMGHRNARWDSTMLLIFSFLVNL